jgi:hypothetical protein
MTDLSAIVGKLRAIDLTLTIEISGYDSVQVHFISHIHPDFKSYVNHCSLSFPHKHLDLGGVASQAKK